MTTLFDDYAAVATVIAALAAVIGLIFISVQLWLQRKQSKLEALTQIHREVATQKFREALGVIFAADSKDLDDPPSKEILDCIRTAAGLYDLLGAGVREGVYPKKATLKTEWKILILLWDRLKKFITNERKQRGTPYKEDFEFLAKQAEAYRDKYKKKTDSLPKIYLRDYERQFSRFAADGSLLSQLVYKGKHLHLYRAKNSWEYVSRAKATSGVTIVAITDENRMLFVEQYRVPMGKTVIELPSGLVGDQPLMQNEEIEVAVRRELQEETGFDCQNVSILSHGPLLPGVTDEANSLCIAEGLKDNRSQKLKNEVSDAVILEGDYGDKNEGEKTTVIAVRLEGVLSWLQKQAKADKAVDMRIYAGLFFLSGQHRKLLFSREESNKKNGNPIRVAS